MVTGPADTANGEGYDPHQAHPSLSVTALGVAALVAVSGAPVVAADELSYPLVDSGQT